MADLVRSCKDEFGSVCKGLPDENKHEGTQYCVLHFPSVAKDLDEFKDAIEKKLKNEDFNFRGVYFPGNESFSSILPDASLEGPVAFLDGNFKKRADFSEAAFKKRAYFLRATFKKGAYFSSATFEGEANFAQTNFDGDADFSNANFKGEVTFSEANFKGEADFSKATFEEDADFGLGEWDITASYGSKFESEANFRSANFKGRANFSFAHFKGGADFSEATFERLANFSPRANFKGGADFSKATFERLVNFSQVSFERWVDFSEATFRERANFWSLQTSPPQAFLSFRDAVIEEPERFSFYSTHLRPSWFVDVDAQEFDFFDVEWFRLSNEKTLELEDEIKALTLSEQTQNERMLALQKLTKACQRLMNNAEENRDYPTANEFHYWSMVLARKQAMVLAGEGRLREGLRRFGLIDALFGALSGYADRPGRATFVLFGMWAVFAILYQVTGSIEPGGQASLYSLAAMVRLTGVPVMAQLTKQLQHSESGLLQVLVTFEGILGPLQIALLALAIRRKVMR